MLPALSFWEEIVANLIEHVNIPHTAGPTSMTSTGTGYETLLPIIDVDRKYLIFSHESGYPEYQRDESFLIVRGHSWIQTHYTDGKLRNYINASYEHRWCTVPALEIANMLTLARTSTREIRILSGRNGIKVKVRGDLSSNPIKLMGTEDAFLLELDGNEEGRALAQKYSFDHQVQQEVNGREVTYNNGIIITRAAADAAMGVNVYPSDELTYTRIEHMAEPLWNTAIDMARTIGRLPERDYAGVYW